MIAGDAWRRLQLQVEKRTAVFVNEKEKISEKPPKPEPYFTGLVNRLDSAGYKNIVQTITFFERRNQLISHTSTCLLTYSSVPRQISYRTEP